MPGRTLRKFFLLGFLLICLLVLPGAQQVQCPSVPDPMNVYVDAAEARDYQNGSKSLPFDNIQDGILAAAEGGTVYVAAGFYEPFDVNKTVAVRGAGIDVTRIYYSGVPCRILSADEVAIFGITFVPESGDFDHVGGTAIYLEDSLDASITACKFAFFETIIHAVGSSFVASSGIYEFSTKAFHLEDASHGWLLSDLIVGNEFEVTCQSSNDGFYEAHNIYQPENETAFDPICTREMQ